MSNRRSRPRLPAATSLLPALLLLSMASAGGFSTGVSSSSEHIVDIVVTAATAPALPAAAPGPLSR